MSKNFMSAALFLMSATTAFAVESESNVQVSGCKDNDFYLATTVLDTEKDDDKVFEVVEQMPKFKGGKGALMQYIAQTIKYPQAAQEIGTQGRFIVSFIIDKDGSIIKSETKVVNVDGDDVSKNSSLPEIMVKGYVKATQKKTGKAPSEEDKKKVKLAYAELEKECVRVVNSMAAWEPGKQRGKAVKVHYNIPLTFRLQ